MSSGKTFFFYEDMLSLPHHQSGRHPRMPMQKRAAQFLPFAALSGHETALKEASRLTVVKKELVDEVIEELNRKMMWLIEHPEQSVIITYFEPDSKKGGGQYHTIQGCLKKVDTINGRILIGKQLNIPMTAIKEIELI